MLDQRWPKKSQLKYTQKRKLPRPPKYWKSKELRKQASKIMEGKTSQGVLKKAN